MYEVPDYVVLEVSAKDTQLAFIRKALMLAAATAGLPLLEQISYVSFFLPVSINERTFRTDWAKAKEDPTPKDNAKVKEDEFETRRGKRTAYYLSAEEKLELRLRQSLYVLNGGVLGSMQESLLNSIITIDLNIVYQENQYNLQEAQAATKATVEDCQNTYGAIDIKFDIIYTPGKGDSSYINIDGSYGRILQGAKEGMINVLLFANNKFNGRSASLYNPASEQIFIWEGSMYAEPTAKNAGNKLDSGAIAHELVHLFFHYAGVSMKESNFNNWSQEPAIYYSLNQMRYNPFFIPDRKLPEDFNYDKDLSVGGFGFRAPRGTRHNPTYEQLIRIGAKRVAVNLSAKGR